MKKSTVLIVIVLSFLFLFSALLLKASQAKTQAKAPSQAKAEEKLSTCDFHKASQEFADYIYKELKDKPAKQKEINKDFQMLANEIMLLNQQGKIDEICIKYTQFKMATK